MPVFTSHRVRPASQDVFGDVAFEVVGCAFEIHKSLGRMFHETTYRSALRRMLHRRAVEEMEIVLAHGCFSKSLFLDLLVDSACPFELKAASCLDASHESQMIQYLMLIGSAHGKLINFGSERVEHQFVNCCETPSQRRTFQIKRENWCEDCRSRQFEKVVVSLVSDWGTGLTRSIYREAVLSLLGLSENRRLIESCWDGEPVAHQPVDLVSEEVAVEITCLKADLQLYESHLERFIANTPLKSVLWANVSSGCVRFQRVGL